MRCITQHNGNINNDSDSLCLCTYTQGNSCTVAKLRRRRSRHVYLWFNWIVLMAVCFCFCFVLFFACRRRDCTLEATKKKHLVIILIRFVSRAVPCRAVHRGSRRIRKDTSKFPAPKIILSNRLSPCLLLLLFSFWWRKMVLFLCAVPVLFCSVPLCHVTCFNRQRRNTYTLTVAYYYYYGWATLLFYSQGPKAAVAVLLVTMSDWYRWVWVFRSKCCCCCCPHHHNTWKYVQCIVYCRV